MGLVGHGKGRTPDERRRRSAPCSISNLTFKVAIHLVPISPSAGYLNLPQGPHIPLDAGDSYTMNRRLRTREGVMSDKKLYDEFEAALAAFSRSKRYEN